MEKDKQIELLGLLLEDGNKKIMKLIERLREHFKYNNYIEDRPAFVCYVKNGYYINQDISLDDLIIKLKKEVKKMDARSLVIEQLAILKAEKEELVAQIKESDKEVIDALRLEAANQAEQLYLAEAAKKVDDKFKLAEDHLKTLLENLPEETVPEAEEAPVAEDTEENPLI